MEVSDGFCVLDLCPKMCLAIVITPDRMPSNGFNIIELIYF